jgi:hypothetical protein
MFGGPARGQSLTPAPAAPAERPPLNAGPARITPTTTVEAPLVNFQGDIDFPAGVDTAVDVNGIMGGPCSGLVLINVTGPVKVSLNGGGLRTVTGTLVIDNAAIANVRIQTGANTCTLQLHGR